MGIYRRHYFRVIALSILLITVTVASARLRADTETTGTCGGSSITIPFTDVSPSSSFFCSIASAFFSGLTAGTTATTYSPTQPVPREQMAAFITRTLDQSLRRGSRRAAIGKWWTNKSTALTFVRSDTDDTQPQFVYCDGNNLWVAWDGSSTVSRHDLNGHANQITSWTDATGAFGIISANGHTAYITGFTNPGRLYTASDAFPFVLTDRNDLPPFPAGIACDGENFWTANFGTGPGAGSISRINPLDLSLTTFAAGFSRPTGILFDGENLWVTDHGDGIASAKLFRVNPATGQITLTLTLGVGAGLPVFDGANLWVPNVSSNTISVVRAVGGLAGTVLATLSGNGLSGPVQGAFDGERILFTNQGATPPSVSLWKAADLTAIGNIVIDGGIGHARGACSDGTYFYISTRGLGAFFLMRL